jgi:hypothetical protein
LDTRKFVNRRSPVQSGRRLQFLNNLQDSPQGKTVIVLNLC